MTARIVELETFIVGMPKRREWTQHGMSRTLEQRVLLRLALDDGTEGWGEATALPQWGGMGGRYFGETVETVSHVIHDLLAPALLGQGVRNPRALMLETDTLIIGHPYAKATLEMALQDARGKTLGAPLYDLLGGKCHDGVRIGHMLGMMSTMEATEEALHCVKTDRITAFQIKGGTDIERDVAVIRALRKVVPASTFLRLDGNKGYGTVPKLVADAGRRLEAAGINAIEQPAASVEAMAACRQAVSVPVIADEACWTPGDVVELWRAGAIDAVSVYVAKAGGTQGAAEVARTAHLLGLRCDVNGSLETGIGNAASMHVALASQALSLPSIIPIPSNANRHISAYAGRYWEDDVVDTGYSYRDGFLYLSDAPGLGIAVNPAKVRKYLIGTPRLSAGRRAAQKTAQKPAATSGAKRRR